MGSRPEMPRGEALRCREEGSPPEIDILSIPFVILSTPHVILSECEGSGLAPNAPDCAKSASLQGQILRFSQNDMEKFTAQR
jgi:hypothetical protein